MIRLLRAALALAMTFAAPASARTLTVTGSETMRPLLEEWAKEFRQDHREVEVRVRGGGSMQGIAELAAGRADLASSSRKLKAPEAAQLHARSGSAPREVTVARDALAFYVHDDNPIGALTRVQLRALFAGEVTRWNQVGGPDRPVVLYARQPSSGASVFLKENLLREYEIAKSARALPDDAAVLRAVAKNPDAIGYASSAHGAQAKAVEIRLGGREVGPTPEAVRTGAYPLSRELGLVTAGEPPAEAQAFVGFCLSPEGQQIALRLGFLPAAPAEPTPRA